MPGVANMIHAVNFNDFQQAQIADSGRPRITGNLHLCMANVIWHGDFAAVGNGSVSWEVKSGDFQGDVMCPHSSADWLATDLSRRSQTSQAWVAAGSHTPSLPDAVQMCTCRTPSEGQWIRRTHLSIILRGNWMAGCEMSCFPAQLQLRGYKGRVSLAAGNPGWPVPAASGIIQGSGGAVITTVLMLSWLPALSITKLGVRPRFPFSPRCLYWVCIEGYR